MPIVLPTMPPGAVSPVGISVAAEAPTSDKRVEVEAPDVGADDLADLARMDSDAG